MDPEAVIMLIDAVDSGKITREQAHAYARAGLSKAQLAEILKAPKPYYGPG